MLSPFAIVAITSEPKERAPHLATAAEEARAADDGRRDRVEQERAAAGVRVDAAQAGREHEPPTPAIAPEIMKTRSGCARR